MKNAFKPAREVEECISLPRWPPIKARMKKLED
jgi:hypothetical protein